MRSLPRLGPPPLIERLKTGFELTGSGRYAQAGDLGQQIQYMRSLFGRTHLKPIFKREVNHARV